MKKLLPRRRRNKLDVVRLLVVVAVTVACAALASAYLFGPVLVAVLAVSVLLDMWILAKNDASGFMSTMESRRATEPHHHLSNVQTFLVMVLVMGQAAFGTFVLLAS